MTIKTMEPHTLNQGLYQLHSLRQLGLSSDSVPVLAIHGWLDNAGSFLPLMNHLTHLPWIALDLIGHGHSQWRPPQSYYYFADYLCDLVSLIEEQFPKGVHLVGHSLGGAIVSMVAGIIPDKVRSVSLFDVLGPLTSPVESVAEQLRLSLAQHRATKAKRFYSTQEIMALARQKRHRIDKTSCKILVEHGSSHSEEGYQWTFDPKLFHLSPLQMTQEQVLSVLKHATMPMLMLKASEGYTMQHKLLQERITLLPQLEYHELQGGHHVHMDNPLAVARDLMAFYHRHGFFKDSGITPYA